MTAGDLLNGLSSFESLITLDPGKFVGSVGPALDVCCQAGRYIIVLLFIIYLVQKVVTLQIEDLKKSWPKDVVILLLLMAVFGTKTGYSFFAEIMMNIYNIFARHVFTAEMAEFKSKMRLVIDSIAESGKNNVDLFNVQAETSILAAIVAAALYLLVVTYYIFASVGGFFMLIAVVIGPLMAGFFFFLKTPLHNWLMLVFASMMFPLFAGIAIVIVNLSTLLTGINQDILGGSLITLLIQAVIMLVFMQLVMVFHSAIFGVTFMNVPARIIGIIQYFNGLIHSPIITELMIKATKKKRG